MKRNRGHVGLISHGSVVPLFGVPPCAVRTGNGLGSLADKAVSLSAEAVNVAEHSSLYLAE